jgi:hypothetical protein
VRSGADKSGPVAAASIRLGSFCSRPASRVAPSAVDAARVMGSSSSATSGSEPST